MANFYKGENPATAVVLSVVILLVFLVAPCCRADECSHLQMSLLPNVQLVSEKSSICGARFDFFWGQNRAVEGFDLGIINGAESMNGVQIGVINLLASKDLIDSWGFQFAVINDAIAYDAQYTGAQVSLFYNSNGGDVHGLQAALFLDRARDMRGVQIAFANSAQDMRGVQIGFANSAQDMHGVQVALWNYTLGSCNGLEIGLFNSCQTLHGVQIGLVNLVTSRQSSFYYFTPLINVGF